MNDESLKDLGSLYEATGNPLYAWDAIGWCSQGSDPRRPLPNWCRDYLEEVAFELLDLAERGGKPAGQIGKAVQILGFTRQGYNAFKDLASADANMLLTFWYERAVKTRRGQDYLEAVGAKNQDPDNVADPEKLMKRIQKARQLMLIQRKKRLI